MFSRLRKRHGTATPIAVLALVVAVAFAGVPAVAQPVANTSASFAKKLLRMVKGANKRSAVANKRSVNAIKLARNAAGTPGPQGPAGPKGDKGDKGAKGDAGQSGPTGPDGTDGSDGKTVLSGFGAPNDALDGVDGDFYIDTNANEIFGPKAGGSWPTPGTSLEGSPWTPDNELPAGATLTGSWGPTDPTSGVTLPSGSTVPGTMTDGAGFIDSVGFSIPLPSKPTLVFVAGEHFGFESSGPAGCPGVVDGVPQADPGTFCVYGGAVSGGALKQPTVELGYFNVTDHPDLGGGGASVEKTGALLQVTCDAPESFGCSGAGLWAVTG